MKTLLAGLLVAGALVVSFAPAGVGATSSFRPAGVIPHSGSAPTLRAARTASNPTGTPTCGSVSCSAYETGINGFFQDVAAASAASATDNVYSVDTQYSDTTGNIAYNETFGGTYVDTRAFPSNGCPLASGASACLTESQLVTEIGKGLSANGWTASSTNLFFILLPAGVDTCFNQAFGGTSWTCASNAFCAYHDSSSSLIFAVEPFSEALSCRAPGEGFPNGAAIDEAVNTISHEQNEAITDPNQVNNAWYSSSGDEIGDLCSLGFGTPLGTTAGGEPYNQVINGHDYSLQLEYSNAANNGAGGCVSHLGGTATGITDNGVGPVTYHGGPVMRTNTVYTIYWLPAPPPPPPVISTAPVVSGTAAVGQQLSTDHGAWTNSPTTYAFRWQRCDNTGSNCSTIPNAVATNYKLVAADAGHEVRSEVLASNATGPAAAGYSPSLPTGIVSGKPKVITKPVLSGTTVVGQALSVTTGSWTYSPTSYAYRWLRCTAAGTMCSPIAAATSNGYTLTSKDAGHKLEAKVTATNAAGSTSVAVKSAKVT